MEKKVEIGNSRLGILSNQWKSQEEKLERKHADMINVFHSLIGTLDAAEKRPSEFEGTSIGIILPKTQRQK